jgi:hypothetical protein
MSEKELRDLVARMDKLWGPIHPFSESVSVLLNEEPDLVSVLRGLKESLEAAGGPPKLPLTDPISEKGFIWCEGYRQALVDCIVDLEEIVRLTDKGYEWIEYGLH